MRFCVCRSLFFSWASFSVFFDGFPSRCDCSSQPLFFCWKTDRGGNKCQKQSHKMKKENTMFSFLCVEMFEIWLASAKNKFEKCEKCTKSHHWYIRINRNINMGKGPLEFDFGTHKTRQKNVRWIQNPISVSVETIEHRHSKHH